MKKKHPSAPVLFDAMRPLDGSHPLSDLIAVDARYTRAVNLERDFYQKTPLRGYICSTTVQHVLQRILNATEFQLPSRAWTIIGPYGGGKSAFALFISKLFSETDLKSSEIYRLLRTANPQLAVQVEHALEEMRPVLVSGSREPLSWALVRGLANALLTDVEPSTARQIRRLTIKVDAGEQISSKSIIDAFDSVITDLRVLGFGLLLIVDELGKILEYTAHHPNESDIFLLQQLAEIAGRQSESTFIVISILHQNFDVYARSLTEEQRREWGKVQGRYEAISFSEPREQVIKMLASAVTRTPAGSKALLADTRKAGQVAQHLVYELNLDLNQDAFIKDATGFFPIHPTVAPIIAALFKRVGQNQRSLFAFLSSREPFGFHDFLQRMRLDSENKFLRLHHLYDYLKHALSGTIFDSLLRTWTLIDTALERLSNPTEIDVQLVKAIGVLMLSGETADIKASKRFLSFACADTPNAGEIITSLKRLEEKSLIVYRRYKDAYVLWEGSDIDIDELVARGYEQVQFYESLGTFMQEEMFFRPIVARRHSLRTGTLRYFSVRIADSILLNDLVHQAPIADTTGTVLYVVYEHLHERQAIDEILCTLVDREDLIVIVPQDTKLLRQAIYDYACISWALTNDGQIELDVVAKREAKNRLSGSEAYLREQIGLTFGINGTEKVCTYWHQGKKQDIANQKRLVSYLSDICDAIYPDCPLLRNEIINRGQPSSNAVKARNLVVQALIEQIHAPDLGIVGFPPEKSIYYSLLSNTTIHREMDGVWGIYPPLRKADRGIRKVWDAIEAFFSETERNRQSLSVLVGRLRERPFGLNDSVIPVFVCAALCYFDTEIAIYEDGTFQTAFTPALFEKITLNPAKFTIRRCRIAGPRSDVFNQMAEITGARPGRSKKLEILDVLLPLFKMISKLPEYSKRTQTMGRNAMYVREAIKRATEPESLMFEELPLACGFEPINIEATADKEMLEEYLRNLRFALAEIQFAYDRLLTDLEDMLFVAFKVNGDYNANRAAISDRAKGVCDFAVDVRLKDFATRLNEESRSRNEWIEAVASLLTRKICSSWNDADKAVYEVNLADVIRLFNHMETVIFDHIKNRDLPLDSIRIGITTLTAPEKEQVVSVTAEEAERVNEIEAELQKILREMGAMDNPKMVLVALSRITQQLFD